MDVVNIGVLGLGCIGKIHIEHILNNPHARLIAIYDELPDDQWLEANHFLHLLCDSKEQFFATADLDAVIIATPSQQHTQDTIQGLILNKHIFCEAPIATSYKDFEAIRVAQHNSGKTLCVGYRHRFNPHVMDLKRAIVSKSLGKIYTIVMHSYEPELPELANLKNAHGLFIDMALQDFDLATYLLDSPISSIHTMGCWLSSSNVDNIRDVDTATSTLRFKNGAIGVMHHIRHVIYGYEQQIELFAEHGSMSLHNSQATHVKVMKNRSVLEKYDAQNAFLQQEAMISSKAISSFLGKIKGEITESCDFTLALSAFEAACAARESWETGRVVLLEKDAYISSIS